MENLIADYVFLAWWVTVLWDPVRKSLGKEKEGATGKDIYFVYYRILPILFENIINWLFIVWLWIFAYVANERLRLSCHLLSIVYEVHLCYRVFLSSWQPSEVGRYFSFIATKRLSWDFDPIKSALPHCSRSFVSPSLSSRWSGSLLMEMGKCCKLFCFGFRLSVGSYKCVSRWRRLD